MGSQESARGEGGGILGGGGASSRRDLQNMIRVPASSADRCPERLGDGQVISSNSLLRRGMERNTYRELEGRTPCVYWLQGRRDKPQSQMHICRAALDRCKITATRILLRWRAAQRGFAVFTGVRHPLEPTSLHICTQGWVRLARREACQVQHGPHLECSHPRPWHGNSANSKCACKQRRVWREAVRT